MSKDALTTQEAATMRVSHVKGRTNTFRPLKTLLHDQFVCFETESCFVALAAQNLPCGPGWPQLTAILLPLPAEGWDYS